MTDFLDTRHKHSSYVDVVKTKTLETDNLLDAVHAIILNYDNTAKSANETKQMDADHSSARNSMADSTNNTDNNSSATNTDNNSSATNSTADSTAETKQSNNILYLQNSFVANNLDCVRTELKQKYGINMNFNDHLAIFSSPFAHRNRHEFFQQREANGLILDIGSHAIVCVPPRILSTMYNTQAVNEGLRNDIYRIYKVLDGTIVTIYWYEKWHIATYRGIYMENVTWHGKKTYREIFDNLLADVGLTWDEFVGMFDKKLCYTYGFKHEEYHAFPDFKTRLWFVQSTVVDNSSKLLLFTSDINPTEKYIPSQPLYDKPVSNIRTLVEMASCAETDFLEGKEPNYGYILRSKDPNKTGRYSDILIESQLMSTIRHCWYDNDDMNRDPDGIFVYINMICLTAVIKTETAKNFTKLFPTYVGQYNEVTKKINCLIDDICRVFTKTPLEINEKQTEIVHALVEYLTTTNDFMWSKTKIEENVKQISDLVKTSRHIPLIYQYIWPN